MKRTTPAILAITSLLLCTLLHAQHTLIVKVSEPKATIQPAMWGIFFEDINLGADGGIYAELVKNRSFEFNKPIMGWKILGKPATEGDFTVLNRGRENVANPRYLRIQLHNNTRGSIGLNNEGFRGMGIKKDVRYDFSFLYRQTAANVNMYVELINEKGESIGGASTTTGFTGTGWKKQSVSFTATATALKASFNIWFEGDGAIDLDMVSVFPGDTWKKRPGGMRADMITNAGRYETWFYPFSRGMYC